MGAPRQPATTLSSHAKGPSAVEGYVDQVWGRQPVPQAARRWLGAIARWARGVALRRGRLHPRHRAAGLRAGRETAASASRGFQICVRRSCRRLHRRPESNDRAASQTWRGLAHPRPTGSGLSWFGVPSAPCTRSRDDTSCTSNARGGFRFCRRRRNVRREPRRDHTLPGEATRSVTTQPWVLSATRRVCSVVSHRLARVTAGPVV